MAPRRPHSHAPWGAWPGFCIYCNAVIISTHTLRGERDKNKIWTMDVLDNFNSHAPWGAWPRDILRTSYKLLISTHTLRGERDIVCGGKRNVKRNFNSHAPWGAWPTYCICEVTPPQQSGYFTKNHFKKRCFLHNMYYIFSEPPYKTNITARSLTKSNCPQDHMFPLHLYAPLSSSNYYPNNRIEGYLVLHQ